MKKMNNNWQSVLLLLALFGLAACTGDFEDINRNPNQVTEEQMDALNYKTGTKFKALQSLVIPVQEHMYQFNESLSGGPFGGYIGATVDTWQTKFETYNPSADWRKWPFANVITETYTPYKGIINGTEDEVAIAFARLLRVAIMHRVTDSYGPIPYTKLESNESIYVEYDSQEAVYTKMFEELDEAIEILGRNTTLPAEAWSRYDGIYYGNIAQWLKYANSLKLRMAMRISYAAPDEAERIVKDALSGENGGVIESNADNATWNYFETSQNPIYVATRYNQVQTSDHGGVPCLTGGDTHAAADIICYMNGYKDNRREKFFTKSEWAGQDYVGMRRGIVIPELKTTGHKYSGVNIAPTSPLYWMNAAEVAFLRAEGQAVFNFSMGGTAESFYNQGIRLSFEQWGADGVEDYLKDDVNKPTAYTDPAGTNTYQNALSNITIKWNDSADKEEKQERIIVQKWIANWQLGNEAWADFRRTGYPKLIPVKENKSGGVVDSEKGARRMPYPLDEFVSNKANVEYAIANYLHGADNMATDVWWASKK